jgi:hypothetical protein
MTLDRDTSRMLVNDSQVFDRSFNLIGLLPTSAIDLTAISNDGIRAFLYSQDAATDRPLEVFDLNGALQIGGLYPRLFTLTLPNAAGAMFGHKITVGPDDSTVFIIGDTHLFVVPLR